MNRATRSAGRSTPRTRASKGPRAKHPAPEAIDRDAIDPDAPAYADVDWDELRTAHFELDPVLVESIRSRQRLRQITLRVGEEQIQEARRVAKETGLPYQTVLRGWLARGASISRTARKKKAASASG
jgi:predicted DNA binding CopG/RHH family protein